ncbi:MAG: DUF3179 domain-containing protein [Chloroflexi bacterium]|nr:DUF3179 domain-containing protein [Chloroflexota bacterium]
MPLRFTWIGRRLVYVGLFILGGVIFAACGHTATETAAAPAQSQPAPISASPAAADAAARAKTDSTATQSAVTAPSVQSPSRSAPAQTLPTVEPTTVAIPTATSAPLQQMAGTITTSPTPDTQPVPTAAPIVTTDSERSSVTPDPDYERALNAARLSTNGWDTDFSLHTVPYSQIRFVIPRDNIPSIDVPKFVAPSEAAWLKDVEPVVSLDIDGDARAYPLQILTWHEIVNDTVGGVPVSVTFCPLCNSAIAFDRRLDGEVLEFGVSGNLRNSDLIMYDRQTHTWWQQFTGEGIVGEHAGRMLEYLPASIVSFADFSRAHPDGKVLSRETGFTRQYGRNPYAGYDTYDGNPFLFNGDLDGRLLPVERVIAVSMDGVDLAFPLSVLQEERVINYEVGERQIAVFHKFGTTSALDASAIAESRDVGAAGVFDAVLDGQTLTFGAEEDRIVDDQTGSAWDIFGNATDGPLAGKKLTPVVHGNHFWFAWAVFKPDTILYQGEDGA